MAGFTLLCLAILLFLVDICALFIFLSIFACAKLNNINNWKKVKLTSAKPQQNTTKHHSWTLYTSIILWNYGPWLHFWEDCLLRSTLDIGYQAFSYPTAWEWDTMSSNKAGSIVRISTGSVGKTHTCCSKWLPFYWLSYAIHKIYHSLCIAYFIHA